MLRAVSIGHPHSTSFPVDPDAEFEPGMIGQLKVINGLEIVLSVSDGLAPLGIIDDVKNEINNTTLGSNRVTIWLSPNSIWQTDQYDVSQPYLLNSILYCGADGRLTSAQPTPIHPGLAIVLRPPTAFNALLEFLWLA